MSHLVALIDDYRDRSGQPSEASIARAIGVAPQTINSWRHRGLRDLPSRKALVSLAELMRVDYETVVLHAALLDTGWIDPPGAAEPDEAADG